MSSSTQPIKVLTDGVLLFGHRSVLISGGHRAKLDAPILHDGIEANAQDGHCFNRISWRTEY